MGSLSGKIASNGLTPTYVNSATNASPGKLYQCDTSSAAFTVTLPTGSTGSVLRFVDDKGTWATNNLTIAPAATQTIQGISGNGSLVCDLSGAYVEMTWDATSTQWCVQTTGFQYGPTASSTLAGIAKAQKQYVAGTAYTNGTPNITCPQAGFSLARGVMVPYQTSDGAWRMRFTFSCIWTSATVSAATFTFSGVTFRNVTNFNQVGTVTWNGYNGTGAAYTNTGVGTFVIALAVGQAGITGANVAADVELESKPTWAD